MKRRCFVFLVLFFIIAVIGHQTAKILRYSQATEKPFEESAEPEPTPLAAEITPLDAALFELHEINEESTTEERIIAMMNYYIAKDFAPEVAAGIIGNCAVESQYRPEAVSTKGEYKGLFQWDETKWQAIETWSESMFLDPWTFETQVRAVIECDGARGCMSDYELERMKNANILEAAEIFAVFYEGCTGGNKDDKAEWHVGYYQKLNLRKSEAEESLRVYNGAEYNGEKPYYK